MTARGRVMDCHANQACIQSEPALTLLRPDMPADPPGNARSVHCVKLDVCAERDERIIPDFFVDEGAGDYTGGESLEEIEAFIRTLPPAQK